MIRPWYLSAALVLCSILTFANVLKFPFIHDDIVFIVQNPNISRLDDLPAVFVKPAHSLIPGVNAYYRPLLEAVYRLEYKLFGFDPVGWHAFNIVLHGLNGALVFWLLCLLGVEGIWAWIVALLFVVHPVQTESVACVAGISNLLMAFFVLLTLNFYLKEKWSLSAVALLLGLLAKEQAVMVLPLIAGVDWYRRKTPFTCWIFFAVGVFAFLILRQVLTGSHLLSDILASPGELKLRLIAIAQTLMMYLGLIIAPHDLHYYRSVDILTANAWWWVVVIGLGAWALYAKREIRFGALWFLIALLPVLNIVPLVNEYSLILTAEHFLYVPMIGMMFVCVVLIKAWVGDKAKIILFAAAVVFMDMSMHQNSFWQSEKVLFERTVRFEPQFARGHLLLAKAYYFDKDYKNANAHFSRSYDIMNGYAQKAVGQEPKRFYAGFMKGILFDWAHSLENMGAWQEAKLKYLDAIDIDPRDFVLWNNLGVVYLHMNETVDAKASFERALALNSTFAPALENLKQIK